MNIPLKIVTSIACSLTGRTVIECSAWMLSSSVPPASASRTEEQQWTRHEALRDLSVQLRHRLGDGTQITTQTKATFQTPSHSASGQQRGWQQRGRHILTAGRPLLVRNAKEKASLTTRAVDDGNLLVSSGSTPPPETKRRRVQQQQHFYNVADTKFPQFDYNNNELESRFRR